MGVNKTILVAGAAGNIGQYTLEALAQQGCSLIGFDLDNKRNRGIAKKFPKVEYFHHGQFQTMHGFPLCLVLGISGSVTATFQVLYVLLNLSPADQKAS